jgi:hypothetical protein
MNMGQKRFQIYRSVIPSAALHQDLDRQLKQGANEQKNALKKRLSLVSSLFACCGAV